MIYARGGMLGAGLVAVLFASSNGFGQTPANQGAAQPSLTARLGLHAFPAKGQSPTQESADQSQCFSWAKTQTGIDPFALQVQAAQAAPPPPDKQAVANAGQGSGARGAAGGAAIGAIAGDAGKGAAIGATVGLVQRRRQRKQAEADQQAHYESSSAASSAAFSQARANFDKAFAACLEGKGYTVK